MRNHGRDTVTVSPPTLDRTDFARLDTALGAPHAPFDRNWLMRRFAEGLQIRLLKPPAEGMVLFQPGPLAWRPIKGSRRALVVQDLRVAPGPSAKENTARLWSVAEHFARYYGLAAVLALVGDGPGLVAGNHAPGRGWLTLDRGPDETRLVGRVLHGPMALPGLPVRWAARAAALGPGVVIQTTGESARLDARARCVVAALRARGIAARHDRLADADSVRALAVRPAAAYSAVVHGRMAGGPDVSISELARLAARAQCPS